MLSPEDHQLLEKPLKKVVELAFNSILRHGDDYIFCLDNAQTATINRKVFSEKQRSLFDSLSEYKIGEKSWK